MKLYLKNPIITVLLCLMAGMFFTVSFMETPLKFQVPGITLPVALGLGKLMFGLSTNIQIVFLISTVIIMLLDRKNHTKSDFTIILIIYLILMAEKFWMLPVLDARADLLSKGKPVPTSDLHNYFIYAETIKTVFLITAITLQFRFNKK